MDEEQDVYDIPLYYAQAAEVHGIARTDTTGSSQSLVNPRRGDTVFTAPSFSRGLTKSTVHSEADPTVFAESPFTDTPQPAPATTSFHIAIAPANPPAVVHVSSNEELSVLPAKQKGRPAFEAILDASYKDGGKARELALRGTPPALWTVDQVGIWAWGIPDMGPEVAKMMRYHKVGGNVLLRLRREDLRLDFGLVLGDAVVLEAEIDKLREVEEAPPMYSVTGRRNH
ncbi:hypothetical protein BC830DRAFT_1113645 [Chytriomyces sp. MP71]|nr:hypothetical protein BC830DRAFT_1113645 [Chytriomyces sp. MP71]